MSATQELAPVAVDVFAKSIYQELCSSGYSQRDVMALAGELLSLLRDDVRSRTVRPAAVSA